MAHIVFAAPPIRRFHLHERLQRALVARGHRVTVLSGTRREHTFLRAQSVDARRLTDLDCAFWSADPPDLVWLHQERSSAQRSCADAASKHGIPTLWSGDGLLPHTMQLDAAGLDAEASCHRRLTAHDLRVVTPDREFLDACLAQSLSATLPATLPRKAIVEPPVSDRLLDAVLDLLRGRPRTARHDLTGWRDATTTATAPPAPRHAAVAEPYALLLLGSATAPAAAEAELRRRAPAAARALGEHARLVVVDDRQHPESTPPNDNDRVVVSPRHHAPVLAAAAAVILTVDHPGAAIGMLAGTPVVHTGDALYALDGATVRTTPDDLDTAVMKALRRDRPALRRRLLTWLLRHGHIWCSADEPHYNGIVGLCEAIERRIVAAADQPQRAPGHRPGPPWPLAVGLRPRDRNDR